MIPDPASESCISCPGTARYDRSRRRYVCDGCGEPWTDCMCGIPGKEATA